LRRSTQLPSLAGADSRPRHGKGEFRAGLRNLPRPSALATRHAAPQSSTIERAGVWKRWSKITNGPPRSPSFNVAVVVIVAGDGSVDSTWATQGTGAGWGGGLRRALQNKSPKTGS